MEQKAENKAADKASADKTIEPRLRTKYKSEVLNKLIESKKYKNKMQIPGINKITLSLSMKDALVNPKALDAMQKDLSFIAGQKACLTKSKKAISNFKLRENINLGAVVTLRRERMYEFLDRFITIACPRIRDFKGFSQKSFDGRGNYSLGVKEHTIFPEVNYDQVDKIRGFNITIGTSAKNDADALELLTEMGFPFKKSV